MPIDAQSEKSSDLRHEVDEIRAQITTNRHDIDDLQVQSSRASERADVSEKQADEDRQRIEKLEHQADLEHELIAVLRAEGALKDEKVAHLEEALGTSRRIGAALGIIMVAHKVNETGAWRMLRAESQNANRKVRDLADDVVQTGDVSGFPPSN